MPASGDGQRSVGYLSPAKHRIAAFIQSCETCLSSHAQRRNILFLTQGAIERGIFLRPICGSILPHDIDICSWGYIFCQKSNDFLSAGEASGQYEMPYEKATLRDPVRIEPQIPHLPVHLADGFPVDFRIIADLRVGPGDTGVSIFHVGHVDVNDTIKQGKRFEGVEAAGVVNQREVEPRSCREQERFQDFSHDMGGRDKIDVVAP